MRVGDVRVSDKFTRLSLVMVLIKMSIPGDAFHSSARIPCYRIIHQNIQRLKRTFALRNTFSENIYRL